MWRDGEFLLADHPDLEAEEALVALGGDRCPCLEMLEAWRAQHVEADILRVGTHSVDESVELNTRVVKSRGNEVARWRSHLKSLRAGARRRGDPSGTASAAAAERAAAQRLGLLHVLSLPPVLQVRLQSSVAAALARQGRLDRLAVPTAVRARPALRALGWVGRPADLELRQDPGDALVDSDRAVLPSRWMCEVWSRGLDSISLDSVADVLVVSVIGVVAGGSALKVRAVTPGKPQSTLWVERWENGWRPT